MSRTDDRIIQERTAPPHPSATAAIRFKAQLDIIEAAIAEKKEGIRDSAALGGFSFERACQALDVITEIAAKLPEEPREQFVKKVALRLIMREPLDLLKICLSTPLLSRIRHMCEQPLVLGVYRPLRQLEDEIASKPIDSCITGELLQCSGHAIVYRSSSKAGPYRTIIEPSMRAMAKILDAHPLVRSHQYSSLHSTTSIELIAESSSHPASVSLGGEGLLSLVIAPTTRPFDLATRVFREDQRSLFDRQHGLGKPKEFVFDSYRERSLGASIPLVANTPAYPSTLLKEFNALVKAIHFQIEGVRARLVPFGDVVAVKRQIRRDFIAASHAERLLQECLKRRDFNRHGIALISECRGILASCHAAPLADEALQRSRRSLP
jgi:hypothetical protein